MATFQVSINFSKLDYSSILACLEASFRVIWLSSVKDELYLWFAVTFWIIGCPLGVLFVCITICSGLDIIGSSDFYLDISPHPSLLVFIAADAAVNGTQC